MNKIYDLVLNYFPLKDSCSFYEWSPKDSLTYVQEMPIIRISEFQMDEIMRYTFQVSTDFLKNFYLQTVTDTGMEEYSILFTDLRVVFAFRFSSIGEAVAKSELLFDEEDIVIEEAHSYEIELLDYQLGEKIVYSFLTRHEKMVQRYLLDKLSSLYEKKEYDEIHYLYCENYQEEKKIDEQYKTLIYDIKNCFSKDTYKLYDILQLT